MWKLEKQRLELFRINFVNFLIISTNPPSILHNPPKSLDVPTNNILTQNRIKKYFEKSEKTPDPVRNPGKFCRTQEIIFAGLKPAGFNLVGSGPA